MNKREQQFVELYQKHRYEHQKRFYESRQTEFESARKQAINLSTLLLILAAVAAALAAINVFELKLFWSVLAAIFPLLSTAVSAYDGLYAFERQAKLYQDALNALHRAQVDAPDEATSGAGYHAALSDYVREVEAVFRREQSQWGQLMSEIKLAEPPSAEK